MHLLILEVSNTIKDKVAGSKHTKKHNIIKKKYFQI